MNNRRFVDTDAREREMPLWAIEISGADAAEHWITFYCKEDWREWGATYQGRFKAEHADHIGVYHGDGVKWVRRLYPAITCPHWDRHYHIDLARPPQMGDFEPFRSDIPESVWNELQEELSGPAAVAAQGDDSETERVERLGGTGDGDVGEPRTDAGGDPGAESV